MKVEPLAHGERFEAAQRMSLAGTGMSFPPSFQAVSPPPQAEQTVQFFAAMFALRMFFGGGQIESRGIVGGLLLLQGEVGHVARLVLALGEIDRGFLDVHDRTLMREHGHVALKFIDGFIFTSATRRSVASATRSCAAAS